MGAVLNTVYNNYLSTYTPKELTRFDTHKKSELRNVYNSIVKLNKESPWYLPTTSKDTQRYAVDLKENARDLHNTIAKLGGLEEEGLFSKKSAFSSNTEVATATFIGEQSAAATNPSFRLEVNSLASPQENMGLFLNNGPVELSPGTYSFDVGINDLNYEFQFAINEGETNRDVQNRLVRLINNADIRLKASVIEDNSLSAIRLTSESTGTKNGKSRVFQISDTQTSKQSGTVSYFGLDYVSREPSNAQFLINGEKRFAASNRFTVDKQFEIELKGISPEDEPVHIGLKTDTDSLTDNVVNLVNGYNDFIKAASGYLEAQSRSRQLIREFKNIAASYSNSFEDMGMNLTEDGTLTIDRARLNKTATEAEDIKEAFGHLKPFANSLLQKSNQVALNPMDYVDKKIVAYKNPGHNFVSPYTTSAYSGMMFNGYC